MNDLILLDVDALMETQIRQRDKTDNESGKIDRKNNIKMLEKYYNQLLQKIDRA